MPRYRRCCCVALTTWFWLMRCAAWADIQPATPGDQSAVTKEAVAGSLRFPQAHFVRITGVPMVVDAHTLEFADHTLIELNGVMDAPDLAQYGLAGDVLYPCGREAAEFLRKFIAGRPVVCYLEDDRGPKPRGDCYLGETRLDTEMVRAGWAISDHSSTQSWELIARLNKRGLWRGTLIEPKKWRQGERLPGEPSAQDTKVRQALAALSVADPLIKLDLNRPTRPVVAIHFRPNYGPVKDDDLIHLAAFEQLRSVELPNKSKITDQGLAHLAGLQALENLDLTSTNVSPAAVIRLVRGRGTLTQLNLTGVQFTNEDLAALKELINLQDLNLRASKINDEGLVHLAAFKQLKRLSLMNTEVTDAGLVHLKNLVDLEELDLDRTKITGAGLSKLAPLGNLHLLQIAHTAVDDAGLAQLAALPKLRGLNVRGTKVTLAGLGRLKQQLPQLDASPDPKQWAAIAGAWDSIDHHAVIGSLFQPVHGARHRKSRVYFEPTINGLVGRAVYEGHEAITGQERWKDGRTDFKNARFAEGKLTFEFEIAEWRPGDGPLAVEAGRLANKGAVRVEARLQDGRLIGTWHMLTGDNVEVYRGEWQATRAIAAATPPAPEAK